MFSPKDLEKNKTSANCHHRHKKSDQGRQKEQHNPRFFDHQVHIKDQGSSGSFLGLLKQKMMNKCVSDPKFETLLKFYKYCELLYVQ